MPTRGGIRQGPAARSGASTATDSRAPSEGATPYRALSNAGLWCIGRLQTDADRERVVEGLGSNDRAATRELTGIIQRLTNRWFVMRDASSSDGPVLLQPRWAMSSLKGPMTRREIGAALGSKGAAEGRCE